MKDVHAPCNALAIAIILLCATAACDRRAGGESGDLSPQTGATNPTPEQSADLDSATAQATTATPSASTVPTGTPPAAGARLNPADESFLTQVNKSNEEEIATTMLGMTQSKDEQVKSLAQMLNGEHVALRDEVSTLSPGTPPSEVAAPADLAQLQGEAFDGRLLAVLVTQHEQAIRAFTDASTDRTLSESVRALATDTLPTLKNHLAEVRKVQGAQGGQGSE